MPLEQIEGTTVNWYHHDQFGSTRVITDSTGAVVATNSYDPYGNLAVSTGTLTNPFLFSGEYRDSESGVYYLQARYYDPTTAQFLTRDPMVATTQSPYAYTLGDPLNATDPSGMVSPNDVGFAVWAQLNQECTAWSRDTQGLCFQAANCTDVMSCANSAVQAEQAGQIFAEESQLACAQGDTSFSNQLSRDALWANQAASFSFQEASDYAASSNTSSFHKFGTALMTNGTTARNVCGTASVSIFLVTKGVGAWVSVPFAACGAGGFITQVAGWLFSKAPF
jgi:RHS repeat-associated protein